MIRFRKKKLQYDRASGKIRNDKASGKIQEGKASEW
jgi:hypothetical protein